MQCLGGYCQSILAHKVNGDIKGVLCFRNATTRNRTVMAGGVQLRLNVETSVVGGVSVEVQYKGKAVQGMDLASSDQIKGNSLGAVASWSNGLLSSLYKLAGQKVQLVVTMNDAKLFSVELGCAQDKPHEMSRTE